MKRLLSVILLLGIVCSLLPFTPTIARAATFSGSCGDKLTWTLDAETGALTISGSGAMAYWSWYEDVPWHTYRSQIKSVSIANQVTSIGRYAFYLCTELKTIMLPDSLLNIDEEAFRGCSELAIIAIPPKVTTIGQNAFLWCTALKSITIPGSVTSIGTAAFTYCTHLTEILVEESSASYCNDDNGILFSKEKTTLVQAPGAFSGVYSIPNSVKSIGDDAFRGCTGLTSVTFSENVKNIGAAAFWGCTGLKSVVIPDAVTELGVYAFAECKGLSSVSIGDGLERINYYSFRDCTGLTSVNIGNRVTKIEIQAFCNCTKLKSVTFTNAVTSVAVQAFRNCSALTDVYFYGTQIDWCAIDVGEENEYLTGANVHFLAPLAGSFRDVLKTAWYFDAVNYAVENGLMNGVGKNNFAPEDPMTRAMLVTVLWRYENSPEEGKNTFNDVPDDQWYTKAVAWAADKGIVGGVGNNRFDPNGNITREQMAAILYRYAQGKGFDTAARGDLSKFPDAGKVSEWAKDAIAWAVAEGIIGGSDGKLLPQGNATRAQVSAILMRFIENVAA